MNLDKEKHVLVTGIATGQYTPEEAYEKLDKFLEMVELEGARKEAYKWFDSWYVFYTKKSLIGKDTFSQWATKRLQIFDAEEKCDCCGWDDAGYQHEPYCSLASNECKHDWVDATNEKVKGTAYCAECGKLEKLSNLNNTAYEGNNL